MPVIAAALVTKNGRVLLSRHFMDVSRIRIEGLLSAFPKLVQSTTSGKQSTFIDSGSVRYVYQPMENLYLVIVTTRGGNIIEDLSTLRLLGRLVTEHVPVITEEVLCENAFEVMFAFDEVVTSGQREPVSMEQVMQILDMHSNEEVKAKEEEERKKKEAKLVAKQKAKEFKKRRMEMEHGISGGGDEGDFDMTDAPPAQATPAYAAVGSSVETSAPAPVRAAGTGGMALGRSRKQDFASKMLKETGGSATVASPPPAQQASAPPQDSGASGLEPVMVKIDERISAVLNRDGGCSSVDVSGSMFVTVHDAASAAVRLHLAPYNEEFNFKTHPNINKPLFASDKVLCIKDNKPYPTQQALSIVKWRAQQLQKTKLPLTISCWPADDSASIEFELEDPAMTLHNVVVSLPLCGAFPTVTDISTGSYQHDGAQSVLRWVIPRIDGGESSGTMDVSLDKPVGEQAFFPAAVEFASRDTMARVSVGGVVSTDTGAPVSFGVECVLSTDQYIVN